MELLLALKRTLSLTGLYRDVREGMPMSPKDIVCLQGREGPQLCSLVNVSRRAVMPTMDVVQGNHFVVFLSKVLCVMAVIAVVWLLQVVSRADRML